MAATPSSRRREGRNAFCLGEDPELLCPYNSDWSKADWMKGYEEVQATYDAEEAEKQEIKDKFDSLKYGCPWNEGDDLCKAIPGNACRDDNCAPWYFKN